MELIIYSWDRAADPAESDREPAGISLAEVAETDAFNATAARAWREQALGCREHHQKLRPVTDRSPAE